MNNKKYYIKFQIFRQDLINKWYYFTRIDGNNEFHGEENKHNAKFFYSIKLANEYKDKLIKIGENVNNTLSENMKVKLIFEIVYE